MKYYKLTLRWDGTEKGMSVDYYDDLGKMCLEIFHYGVEGFPCIENVEEISKEEYESNYLPV